MFNFMQGKEFAGQERACGAAAFASGRNDGARQQQWLHLIESQERCFQVFAEFAGPRSAQRLARAADAGRSWPSWSACAASAARRRPARRSTPS